MPDQRLTHRPYIRNNAIDAIPFLKVHRADIWLTHIRLHYEEMKDAEWTTTGLAYPSRIQTAKPSVA